MDRLQPSAPPRGKFRSNHELPSSPSCATSAVVAAKAQQRSRGDDTRARIFVAAVRLFEKHGYADTTVDRVVREAGVAKGTFFIHFATKDAVITELVRNQVHIARRSRDRVLATGGSPVDALRAAVMTLGEQAAADRQLTRAVITANILSPALGGFAESVFGGIIAEMMDDVRAAQRLHLLDPKVEAEKIAGTLITSYFGAALHFATAPKSKPLLQLLAPVVEANLAGFSVAAAPKATPKRAKRRAGRERA
jgi:AcrR family transcriptional regulator